MCACLSLWGPIRAVIAVATGLAISLGPSRAADPAEELRRFTLFGDADLGPLASGTVLGKQADLPKHPRGIAVETLFFVPMPPAETAERILRWNPQEDAGLGVYVHDKVSVPPTAADFASLNRLPETAPVRRLVSATLGLNPNNPALFMSRGEAAGIDAATAQAGGDKQRAFSLFWSNLLLQRAQVALNEGIHFLPPYQTGQDDITVAGEIGAMLASNKRIRSQFGRLIAFTRLAGRYADDKEPPLTEFVAGKGIKTHPYWELFNIQGEGTINLGVMYAIGAKDGRWQVVDCQYYVSGGYMASLFLYQLWPMTLDGQAGSLIWRGDLLSSPGFTYAQGIERQATGMVMLREVKKSVEQLRRDITQ